MFACAREYILIVEEDPLAGIGAEGLRLRDRPLAATELSNIRNYNNNSKYINNDIETCPLKCGNTAVKYLTDELKNMDPSALTNSVARELIERRDIEDILFS